MAVIISAALSVSCCVESVSLT